MLAKIFGIVLGIVGITTTTIGPPTPPAADVPQTPPIIKTVEKNTTDTNKSVKNTKDKPGNFSKLKLPGFDPKTTTTATEEKTQSHKPAKKLAGSPSKKITSIEVPATESPMQLTATATPTSSPPLSTLNPIRLNDTNPNQDNLADPGSSGLKLETNLPPPNDWIAINQETREAVVNIICTSKHGGLEPLSGSGVIIDPRGIILTNAHVAQYFLLENYRVKNFLTCVGRMGSPATPKYTLKILYISRQWLQENYKNIISSKPMGTGENDYALLQITGSTNPDLKLPASFPYIAFDGNEDNIKTGNQVLLASYPAGFLGGISIQRDLYIVSTLVNTGKLYTFKDGSLDVFGLGGSPVAQRGSSGGATVSGSGKLLGIIVTSTDAVDTSKRDLDAISVAHINRSLSTEINLTLNSLFASDIPAFGKKFDEEILPKLKKLLADELDSKNR